MSLEESWTISLIWNFLTQTLQMRPLPSLSSVLLSLLLLSLLWDSRVVFLVLTPRNFRDPFVHFLQLEMPQNSQYDRSLCFCQGDKQELQPFGVLWYSCFERGLVMKKIGSFSSNTNSRSPIIKTRLACRIWPSLESLEDLLDYVRILYLLAGFTAVLMADLLKALAKSS